MFVHRYDEMRRAHLKVVECRNLALPHLDPPGERVAIPYESSQLYGNLRKPHGIARLWSTAKEKLRLWPFPH